MTHVSPRQITHIALAVSVQSAATSIGESDMLVNIDGVTKTLRLVAWRGPNLGSQWNEMDDMRAVAAHRLPWHLCTPGMKFRTNGHEYEIISLGG